MQNELRMAAAAAVAKLVKTEPMKHILIVYVLWDHMIVTMITIYESENVLSIAYVCILCTTIILARYYWYITWSQREVKYT